jgi:hypothetical protein
MTGSSDVVEKCDQEVTHDIDNKSFSASYFVIDNKFWWQCGAISLCRQSPYFIRLSGDAEGRVEA